MVTTTVCFEDEQTELPTFDFIFFVQKDESNYENCILYNTKSLTNFMNRFSIDLTEVDIHFQRPFIIDNDMEPANLKQHISDSLDSIAIRTTERMQERDFLADFKIKFPLLPHHS